ncbi:MAG: DUF2460 domain-containing protein [Proteobacteria bacterium]|nr:DUF2460 domain-containing protein [Pseudomonadota bacterium]
MTAFPDLLASVRPSNPLAESIEYRTLVSEYESGREATKQKRLFPKRSFPLKYKNITVANARILWQFFMSRRGKHLPFNFFHPFEAVYVGEYVGTADGATAIYNMPSKLASGYTVYVGGVAKASGVDYTFTAEGGEDGADKITFAAPPAAGQHITCDFSGRLKVRCKFGEDVMNFETFYNRLVTTGLTLKGQLNA